MRFLKSINLRPEQYLARDEALLDWVDTDEKTEVMHIWASDDNFIVAGYANKVELEVNLESCERYHVPLFRRCSGGGTVLQGPGCINYSLVLDIEKRPELATITGTNRYVMERNLGAIQALVGGKVTLEGHTDLALDGRKFSGNAQRRKRRALIFHGTFLLDFDLAQIQRFLAYPSKTPDYRGGRSHLDFVTNLRVPAERVIASLRKTWDATEPLGEWPEAEAGRLAREKYASDEWNRKF